MTTALVIGAGPAGLMAAEVMAQAGVRVTVADQMPSPARKFLMAGKSGLNLTKAEEPHVFRHAFAPIQLALVRAIAAFGPDEVQDWARGLGQEVFTGSTGRVFPKAMKASPLLRAWLGRLDGMGVELRRRWRWTGWDGQAACFDTPQGAQKVTADVTVLAMGGASWSRLGSDGKWADVFGDDVVRFEPANSGIRRSWSAHMQPFLGQPVKAIALMAGDATSRGEVILSAGGIEGGGIYALTPALRRRTPLLLDLVPDMTLTQVMTRWEQRRKGQTLTRFVKSTLGLSDLKTALYQELAKEQGLSGQIGTIKQLPFAYDGLAPIDQAISTAGGLGFGRLDGWMLARRPGVFAAGEMLDWEAPTGGYLITACLATGRAAGLQALDWMGRDEATGPAA